LDLYLSYLDLASINQFFKDYPFLSPPLASGMSALKFVTALGTAVDNDGTLDKEATSYNDIFDAFRLELKFYYFGEKQ
jgi:hypothetical protein